MQKIKHLLFIFALSLIPFTGFTQGPPSIKFPYDSVAGDPLKARIYTLENGLKVYLSVYKDEPRIQSMIGVLAGSKQDPADHTGLAHYLEHLLFKGTDVYGTNDFAKEKSLLDTIVSLYEQYGAMKDSLQRKKMYHRIDSISGEAAKFAIPNEFDKMMEGLGVTQVNAYTSNEQTVYINNVPSNQLENFLTVEAERFRKLVMRLFHTELEAVYEEKNISLDRDNSKVYETLYANLFENHQYGTQTTIGTIEHLKSPSLVAIQKFFDTYYVPNNMVIALSGDFDPDEAIRLISEKFGNMLPKKIPPFTVASEKFIKVPIVKEVWGPDAENLMMGFRFNGANSSDADLVTIVDYILSNGQAGLLDLNLNTKQKVLSAGSSADIMKDYSVHMFSGRPREGQSLEEVRDLLLGQIMEMKLGNFPDWMLEAVVNNLKLEQERQYESNYGRASAMLNSEIEGVAYKNLVNRIERLSKINKEQVKQFVRDWYGDNYVIVYKRSGVDPSTLKVEKPSITPVAMNRDMQSEFLKNIFGSKVKEISPVFIDFSKAITTTKLKSSIPVYSLKNTENSLFSMNYTVEMGNAQDKRWPLAMLYVDYLGADKYSAEQLKEEFYKLGCSYSASASEDEINIRLSGISNNFIPAMMLLESLLSNPVADEAALKNLVDDILKKRANAKLNKGEILSRVSTYARFGPESAVTYLLSEEELKQITGKELAVMIRNLMGYVHRIDYYGTSETNKLIDLLNKFHKTPRGFQAITKGKVFTEQSTDDGKVFFVNYDMKQAEVQFLSKGGNYDKNIQPVVQMYSRYFGGGMSSPVFQTMRESKALAYAVSSRYISPNRLDRSYLNMAYIGTQADKLPEALDGMMELLQEMPVSEKSYSQAKEGVLQGIASDRITKMEILRAYHGSMKMGINYDLRKEMYEKISTMSIKDIEAFHLNYIKGKKYRIACIGDKEKIDFKTLEKFGPVTELDLKQVFGY